MNDDIGLDEDLEPTTDATEGVKGGVSASAAPVSASGPPGTSPSKPGGTSPIPGTPANPVTPASGSPVGPPQPPGV